MKKRTNPVIEMVNSDVTTSRVSTLREVGDQTIYYTQYVQLITTNFLSYHLLVSKT